MYDRINWPYSNQGAKTIISEFVYCKSLKYSGNNNIAIIALCLHNLARAGRSTT